MGPVAGCLGSQWQWDTEAVSQAGSFNPQCPATHLLEGMNPHPADSGNRGRCVSHTAGPFAESDRLATPTGGLQDTPLLTPGSARPQSTGHRRCCGFLKALWDAGEMMAVP